jgi:hypothetical protein
VKMGNNCPSIRRDGRVSTSAAIVHPRHLSGFCNRFNLLVVSYC